MLTVKEAATRAGVSVQLVYAWCDSKELPHFRLGNKGKHGTIRISEGDLTRFLEARKHGKQPEAAAVPTSADGDFGDYYDRIMTEVAKKTARQKPRS